MPNNSQPPKKILVVDDDTLNQRVVKAMLEEMGYQVSVAINGYKALCVLDEGVFDLIISDINMPKMDGIEMTEYIRDSDDAIFNQTPIIGMTANTKETDIQKAKTAGMNEVLPKPIHAQHLKKVVQKFLNKRKRKKA